MLTTTISYSHDLVELIDRHVFDKQKSIFKYFIF